MTQKQLKEKYIEITGDYWGANKVLELINQHVAEVIGEDEHGATKHIWYYHERNKLRAEQRKRARL